MVFCLWILLVVRGNMQLIINLLRYHLYLIIKSSKWKENEIKASNGKFIKYDAILTENQTLPYILVHRHYIQILWIES